MYNSHWNSCSFPALLGVRTMSFRGIFQKTIPRMYNDSKSADLPIPAFLLFPQLAPHKSHWQVKISIVSEHYEGLKKLKSDTCCNYNQQISANDWGPDLVTGPWALSGMAPNFTVAQKLDLAFAKSPTSQVIFSTDYSLLLSQRRV